MRIAVWHNLFVGGACRALGGHLAGLREAGHELEIWTPGLRPEQVAAFREFGPVHVEPFGVKEADLLTGYKDPVSIRRTRRIIARLKEAEARCARHIDRGAFDLAFVNGCSVSYLPLISSSLECPSVIYLNEPYRWLYEASPENRWRAPREPWYRVDRHWRDFRTNYARRIEVREEVDAARRYGRILVNSRYSRECVLRAYGIEATVCKLGVDTRAFHRREPVAKANYVVSVGLLYPPKGADRVIDLIARLPKPVRPALQWIAHGHDPAYRQRIEAQAKRLGVDVVFRFDISDAEMVACVSEARFMLYAPRLEPLGLVPLEAGACGTWVIGLAEGGVRETVSDGQNGYLLDGLDDARFPAYAEALLRDEALAGELGSRAREHVRAHWDIERMKRNLVGELEAFARRRASFSDNARLPNPSDGHAPVVKRPASRPDSADLSAPVATHREVGQADESARPSPSST